MVNLLVAFGVYLVAAWAIKGLVRLRSALGFLRLIRHSARWPHLRRVVLRHRGLLLTLPNVAWALAFAGLVVGYAALVRVVLPEAALTPSDLAGHPWLWVPLAVLAAVMVAMDASGLFVETVVADPRAVARLDGVERFLAWSDAPELATRAGLGLGGLPGGLVALGLGGLARVVADRLVRRRLLRTALAVNAWIRRSLVLFVTRLAVALWLWLAWALAA